MRLEYLDIVEMLNDMAEAVAYDFLGKPKLQGPRIYGDCHGKCSVTIKGENVGLVGLWQGQRQGAKGGNLIHLIEIGMGMTHGEAVRYAKSHYLKIEDKQFTDEEKREWAKRQELQKQKSADRDAMAQRNREKKIETVKGIWSQAVPIKGTLAEAYLTRRICKYDWPASLKFHGSLLCEMDKKRHPALIAGVQNKDRKLISIWRIFLNPDGTNLKINNQKVKMGLGPSSGGLVRLSKIESTCNVGEGLESTLAAMAFNKFNGSWACALSTSGMRGFDPIDGIDGYNLWLDADYSKFEGERVNLSPGKSAGYQKKADLEAIGLTATCINPPEGTDWQDVWESSH